MSLDSLKFQVYTFLSLTFSFFFMFNLKLQLNSIDYAKKWLFCTFVEAFFNDGHYTIFSVPSISILYSVFLTLSDVSRTAGLECQHSCMIFDKI